MKKTKICIKIVCLILAVSMFSVAAFADERGFSKRRERQSEKRPQVGFRADRSFGSLRGIDENYLSGLKEKIDNLEQQDIKERYYEIYKDLYENSKLYSCSVYDFDCCICR